MKQLFAVAFAFGLTFSAFADHGHGGGFGGGHGGGHVRTVVCSATNLRGMVFTAHGKANRRFQVQQRAMDKCVMAGSRVCRATGCN